MFLFGFLRSNCLVRPHVAGLRPCFRAQTCPDILPFPTEEVRGVWSHSRSHVARSYPAPLSSWGGCHRTLTRSSARHGSVCSWPIAVCRYLHPIRSARAWREDPIGSGCNPGVGGCPAGWRIGCPQVRQMVSVREDGGAELPPGGGCNAPRVGRRGHPRPSVIGRIAWPPWSLGSWR